MRSTISIIKKERRLIEQGAVSINDERVSNPNHEFYAVSDTVIKVEAIFENCHLKNILIVIC